MYDERRPGWVLAALYLRFGRRAADVIGTRTVLQRCIRPLVDLLHGKALGDSARLVQTAAAMR